MVFLNKHDDGCLSTVHSHYRSGVSVILLAYALFVGFAVRLWIGIHSFDDAYITFRYADNLATGHGLVYNLGEAVLGTSTPLFAVLLAVCRCAGLAPSVAAWIVALVADSVTVVLVWRVLNRWRQPAAAVIVVLLLALVPCRLRAAASGMETALYAALLLGVIDAADQGLAGWAGALAGLAALTRPDGVLIGILAGVSLRRELRSYLRAYGLVVAPWFLFAVANYGSPLPQSIFAKRATLAYLDPWSPWVEWMRRFSTQVTGRPVMDTGLTLVALAGGAVLVLQRRWMVPILLLGTVLGYALGRAPVFEWYFTGLLPLYAVCAAVGIRFCVHRASARARRACPSSLAWSMGTVVALTAFGLHTLPEVRSTLIQQEAGREELYRRAGEYVRSHIPVSSGNEQTAAVEIGALGYTSGARILDLFCLVSPQNAAYYQRLLARRSPLFTASDRLALNQQAIRSILEDSEPLFYVTVTAHSLLPEDLGPWFNYHYELKFTAVASAGDRSVHVFRRRALPRLERPVGVGYQRHGRIPFQEVAAPDSMSALQNGLGLDGHFGSSTYF